MRGGGRFGSDYKRRLAAKRVEVKQQPKEFGRNYGPITAGSAIGMGLEYFGNRVLKPAVEKAQGDIAEVPNIGKSKEGTLFGALAIGSLLGNPRGAAKELPELGRELIEELPKRESVIEQLVSGLSREARMLSRGPAPKVEETPRNIPAFTPSKRDAEGFWETVERPAIDEISGLPAFDPSEIRSAAFGGVGDLVKGTPLENLNTLAIADKATTIRAIYKPPSANEILKMMKKTDRAVPSRLKAKRDRINEQINKAQEEGDMDSALRLQAELDRTLEPKKWKFNQYNLQDAEALRNRWIDASNKFEEQYGEPLPWRLEADYLDEFGNTKTARIFGQDVEHGIPVNRGGKGKAKELTLLPTIPNVGKGDAPWEDYAEKNPEKWIELIDRLYGEAIRF